MFKAYILWLSVESFILNILVKGSLENLLMDVIVTAGIIHLVAVICYFYTFLVAFLQILCPCIDMMDVYDVK